MADAELQNTEDDGKSGKRKIVIGAIAGVLLLTLGVGGAYVMDWINLGNTATVKRADGTVEQIQTKPVVFYDLPEMTVNLSTQGRTTYLKVRIALEVESDSMVSQVEPYLPRILDAFQIYLRELRPADLEGSAGLFRLKEQLLRRINSAIYPAKVEGVLFKEILIQ
ncbi:Flagellar FliL protein [Pseudovibrio sp. Ad46]|uniref:flagellar basal body-associated FliL family protein n=1 Tax=unclassified Pseudovibrio TaxID=2627060 RepID=UPI0007AEB8C4|nr:MULTISPECIES: flagellar basal body-associated FliL family protein [unclassified Pseudovibrio]KZK77654.1 Flagellar FliL protein [Pseudovibrio sp. Ad46]KZK93525.1 Flagellar FliL protein [Pseudovibrio sp. Ad5]